MQEVLESFFLISKIEVIISSKAYCQKCLNCTRKLSTSLVLFCNMLHLNLNAYLNFEFRILKFSRYQNVTKHFYFA